MLESTDTLWRYTKISTLLLLLEGKAWLPSVASLRADDPLEGALGEGFYPELWSELIKLDQHEETERWLNENLDSSARKLLALNPRDAGLRTQILGQTYCEILARRRSAWCWFRSHIESSTMWSIYGNRGVAIMTDRHRLEEAMPRGKSFKIQEMAYVDRRPSSSRSIHNAFRHNPELIRKPYFLKAIEYEDEKEIRVVAHCPEGAHGVMLTDIDPVKLIREITISPLFPKAEADALISTLSQKLPSATITRSRLLPESESGNFIPSLIEGLFGSTDDNMNLEALPEPLRQL